MEATAPRTTEVILGELQQQADQVRSQEPVPGAPADTGEQQPNPDEQLQQPTAETPAETLAETPEETPVEAQPPTEEVPLSEPEETELEEAHADSGNFGKFKDAIKLHPELRDIIGAEAAFRRLCPSFQTFKQIMEWVPDLESGQQLVDQAEQARRLGTSFREDPQAFLDSLRESDSNAYTNFVARVPELLAHTDERMYTEQARHYVSNALTNLDAIARQTGNKDLLTAVGIIAQQVGIVPGQPNLSSFSKASSERSSDPEVTRLRKQLEEREQRDAQDRLITFTQSVNSTYQTTITDAITSTVKGSIQNYELSDGQLRRIVGEIYDKVEARVKSAPAVGVRVKEVQQKIHDGKVNSLQQQKDLVDFLTKRARAALPAVAREVIGEWTGSVLRLSQQTAAKKEGIADKTKDPAAGTSAGAPNANDRQSHQQPPRVTPGANIPSGGNGAVKRSFGSIMEALSKGTYTPPAA